jgi:hypothetical protein
MNTTTATNTRSKNGLAMRLRIEPAAAQKLRELPATVRAEVLTLLVNASLGKQGIELASLIGYRQELKNLGLLLNQSLRVSHGQTVNVATLQQVVEVISQLTQRKQT